MWHVWSSAHFHTYVHLATFVRKSIQEELGDTEPSSLNIQKECLQSFSERACTDRLGYTFCGAAACHQVSLC